MAIILPLLAVPFIAGAAFVGLLVSTLTTHRKAAMWIAGTVSALALWAPLVTVVVLVNADVGDTRSEDLVTPAIFLLLVTAATCALSVKMASDSFKPQISAE